MIHVAVQILLDVLAVAAMVAALIIVAGMVKDFLVENLVDILVDMPVFHYHFDLETGSETGGQLFHIYRAQRDAVIWPLVAIGAVSWLVAGKFGHRVGVSVKSEQTMRQDAGVHPLMRGGGSGVGAPGTAGGAAQPFTLAGFGAPQGAPGKTGEFLGWFYSLPSRCLFIIILLLVAPPVWDFAVETSGFAASKILNPQYSGDPDKPCPPHWYAGGNLDLNREDVKAHFVEVQWLLAHDKTGRPDAMCSPEMKVRYMLEQWGGETKAIPPPLDTDGGFFDMVMSAWDNAAEWFMRGLGEFFLNVVFGVIKAQAVIMSGTMMAVSNIVVDIGVATMLVFMPAYFMLNLIPFDALGQMAGRTKETIDQYAPAILIAALIYPIEVAILFSISSELMVGLLLSDYGSDLLVVWLFGTTIVSMVVAIPIVSLGAFSAVVGLVTDRLTQVMQGAQGAVGMMGGGAAAMGSGGSPGGATGGVTGKAMGGVTKGGSPKK